MRHMNRVIVLRAVRTAGPMSRADIARVTGLSKPTVTNIVEDLKVRGLVRPSNGSALGPAGGRRGPLCEFSADLRMVLGVDIGGHEIRVALANLHGEIVANSRRYSGPTGSRRPEQVLRTVKELADGLLAQAGSSPDRLLAVGVGTPGVVSSDGVVTLAPQLDKWEGLNLRVATEDLFGCRAHVEREVTLSLLAEQWKGAAQDATDALFIQIGVGIGAALLLDGRIYRGADGSAGELGMMPLPTGSPPVLVPGFGPFESACGGSALAWQGARAAAAHGGSALRKLAGGDPSAVTAETVFAAAADGDRVASGIVERALDVLAIGVAGLVCVLNPGVVILGGGLAHAGDQVLEPLVRQLAVLTPFPPKVVLSSLGKESVTVGAVRRVTETIEQDLLGMTVAP
jgi:predicted NBD/HSP70 family sugar kinase